MIYYINNRSSLHIPISFFLGLSPLIVNFPLCHEDNGKDDNDDYADTDDENDNDDDDDDDDDVDNDIKKKDNNKNFCKNNDTEN